MAGKYNYKKIEKKWQKIWENKGVYKNYGRPKKFYVLDMFPYPSGEGLHVGHPRGYIATDVIARYKMMRGFSVLHPIGWDAFGLPAENYAIKNKIHPKIAVDKNIATYKKQLKAIGLTYDWDREINTTDPNYYRWTQWMFLKMFEKGLAYESFEPINWCPSCKTGLANEDLEEGRCERCGSEIEKKPMRQWMLKMTAYADKLLDDLNLPVGELDWPKSIIEQQKNWIGKSEGAIIKFKIQNSGGQAKFEIPVFTTRVDTIFGCTYLVVAPENEIISKIIPSTGGQISNRKEVEKYIQESKNKSDLQRTDLAKEKTGVELKGIRAINPFNSEEISIFAADYVLGHYGTGAVMAVPAHDERDWEFAQKYNLPIKESVLGGDVSKNAFTQDGILTNSGQFSGMASEKAREEMIKWLKKNKFGDKKINYKLRDWVFSRQRYWGEPIPIIHCEKCGIVPVLEKDLPIKLPEVKLYKPTGTGESPLANIEEWVNTKCPKCGGPAKRETNTMPQWAGSSWYYLAYLMLGNQKYTLNKKEFKKWLPVDLYVGGVEHATRHLLYARFWHKFLYDIGIVPIKEPFKKLINQGLILGEDNRKMSKRWKNTVNPDDIIEIYGADVLRLYEMFMGPFNAEIAWSMNGIKGMKRFLDRVHKLISKIIFHSLKKGRGQIKNKKLEILSHKTIKKVTEDIENFQFNTAISSLMILLNEMEKNESRLSIANCQLLVKLLSPFAPHLTEELYQQFTKNSKSKKFKSIFQELWPKYDKNLIIEEEFELIIQINGKMRDKILISKGISQKEAEKTILSREKIKNLVADKKIKKVIFVPDRLINIVL